MIKQSLQLCQLLAILLDYHKTVSRPKSHLGQVTAFGGIETLQGRPSTSAQLKVEGMELWAKGIICDNINILDT